MTVERRQRLLFGSQPTTSQDPEENPKTWTKIFAFSGLPHSAGPRIWAVAVGKARRSRPTQTLSLPYLIQMKYGLQPQLQNRQSPLCVSTSLCTTTMQGQTMTYLSRKATSWRSSLEIVILIGGWPQLAEQTNLATSLITMSLRWKPWRLKSMYCTKELTPFKFYLEWV